MAVPGCFVVLHLIEGQIVQPLTVGRRLKVNVLVILLAVWFGFWFWGIPGVLLAVPALVALKIAAEHEPSWRIALYFLAPNENWRPRSLERLVKAGEQDGPSLSIIRHPFIALAIADDPVGDRVSLWVGSKSSVITTENGPQERHCCVYTPAAMAEFRPALCKLPACIVGGNRVTTLINGDRYFPC